MVGLAVVDAFVVVAIKALRFVTLSAPADRRPL
jgi:hypothetical protein